jgi:hypothetical protein
MFGIHAIALAGTLAIASVPCARAVCGPSDGNAYCLHWSVESLGEFCAEGTWDGVCDLFANFYYAPVDPSQPTAFLGSPGTLYCALEWGPNASRAPTMIDGNGLILVRRHPVSNTAGFDCSDAYVTSDPATPFQSVTTLVPATYSP